jgi:predicted MFS family arabinose efflux permease
MSAGGAAFIPLAADRFGAAAGAMVLHLAQAAAVVAMALVAGPAAAIVLYLVTLGLHGALNPLYQTLVHRHAGTANRTTIVSATSMAAHPGGALGGLALGALADRTSVSAAMVAGAVVLAGAAPLYVPALRHRHAADAGAGTKAEGEPGAGRGGGGDLGDGPSQ